MWNVVKVNWWTVSGSAREENPIGSTAAVMGGEGFERGRGVFRIDGKGDDADIGKVGGLFVDALHAGAHQWAGSRAGRIDEVGNPNLAAQTASVERTAFGIGHREGRDLIVLGKFGGPVRAGDCGAQE